MNGIWCAQAKCSASIFSCGDCEEFTGKKKLEDVVTVIMENHNQRVYLPARLNIAETCHQSFLDSDIGSSAGFFCTVDSFQSNRLTSGLKLQRVDKNVQIYPFFFSGTHSHEHQRLPDRAISSGCGAKLQFISITLQPNIWKPEIFCRRLLQGRSKTSICRCELFQRRENRHWRCCRGGCRLCRRQEYNPPRISLQRCWHGDRLCNWSSSRTQHGR